MGGQGRAGRFGVMLSRKSETDCICGEASAILSRCKCPRLFPDSSGPKSAPHWPVLRLIFWGVEQCGHCGEAKLAECGGPGVAQAGQLPTGGEARGSRLFLESRLFDGSSSFLRKKNQS
jgi:hypothetical protein